MANYTYLTQNGYDRLKAELEELKTTGRQEAARAIAEARAQGDLS
ncbi:MAG TPA: transcription elongation factor GreA, partial [Saprospiraceae bacterium]|nr:transcription elongation factor GreA [Saprospiraceae bacterium]